MSKIADLSAKASDDAKKIVQKNVDAASQQAREAADRFSRTPRFHRTGQRATRPSVQAEHRSHHAMRHGSHPGLPGCFPQLFRAGPEAVAAQPRRSDQADARDLGAGVHAIQSELVREGLQHMVQDSKAIAEGSVRAVEEAIKAFTPAHSAEPHARPLKSLSIKAR